MAQPDVNKIAEQYSGILKEIGADLDSEGMKETPLRAAKALVEMTERSRMETDQLTKMFKAECNTAICHDMVIVEGIKEVGLCEHLLLPITMNITIAYVPEKRYWDCPNSPVSPRISHGDCETRSEQPIGLPNSSRKS